MTEPPPNGMPQFYPGLVYRDAPKAIAWLEQAFGFRPILVVPGEGDTVTHAELAFGTGVLMLGTARGADGQPLPEGTPVPNKGPYVYVSDLEQHYKRARAAGAEITRPLEQKDYGGAGYSARDLEGNEWSFGTYVPSLEPLEGSRAS